MLEIKTIRDHRDHVRDGLRKRYLSAEELELLDRVIAHDDERKKAQTELDGSRAEVKQLSAQIGQLYKSGDREAAEGLKQQVSARKERGKQLEQRMQEAETAIHDILLRLPNVPHPSVPMGKSDADNEVYRDWTGALPQLDTSAKPHWELGSEYGILDMELGVKITGSGFPVLRNHGARLQRGLINFFLDEARRAGFEEIVPPLLVNEDSAYATGQLPDKEGQMYHAEKDDLYLIPTSEVPVTNILRNEILDESDLPVRYTSFTPCFRREAGSYGADVRGLNRVHQFDKVEIVQVAHPERSYQRLEEMVTHVASLLDKLELPYRILRLCSGDLGFVSALTFDFEVYSAAQQRWLEVSSVSNFETFQSNRLRLRYRDAQRQIHLAHTLNGSALALARIVAALLENNQSEDGIYLPKVLHDYVGFSHIPKP